MRLHAMNLPIPAGPLPEVDSFFGSGTHSSFIGLHRCGNQIGAKFWEVIADEHGIDPTGKYLSMAVGIPTKLAIYQNCTQFHGGAQPG